jgi:type IV secretion system protein VirD4
MILHFGDMDSDTHGSARFATDKEVAPLTRSQAGLLVGRDTKTGRLLRYEASRHESDESVQLLRTYEELTLV